MSKPETLSFNQFAEKYCERQENTPDRLKEILQVQKARLQPTGWMLLECQMIGSHKCGNLVILPYGGSATYKEIPDGPITPTGSIADMSSVIAILPSNEI